MFGARRKSSAKLTKNQPFSLVFHHFVLSPSQPHLLPPLISATVSTTNRPPSSHRGLLPLLLLVFLSPLQLLFLLLCFLCHRPPSPQPKSPEPSDRHPQHDRRSSPPQVVLLPASPPSSLSRPLHAEFISACSGRIINFVIGPGQFWPSPNGWAGLARPPNVFFFEKNPNFFLKIIKKNHDFLKYFSIHFA